MSYPGGFRPAVNPVGELGRLRRADQLDDLAGHLAGDDETGGLLRMGTVDSVQGGDPPTYTVISRQQTIGDIRVISGVGVLPGDTVFLLADGSDWSIIGVTHPSVRTFTPQLTKGGIPVGSGISSASGWYRMLGPTTLWLAWRIDVSSTLGGSTKWGIGGLPYPAAVDQQIPMTLGLGAGGGSYYDGAGHIPATAAAVDWIAVNGAGGAGIQADTSPMGAGSFAAGAGVLEVVLP